MTRTITTAAELDALPVGSVVMTADGRPLHKSTWGDAAPAWFEGAQRWAMTSASILDVAGPLTVLHDPSAPAPAPSADAAEGLDKDGLTPVEQAVAKALWSRWAHPDPVAPTLLVEEDPRTVAHFLRPFLASAPSATREDVETITIPRPHVPHGPAHLSRDAADADYLRKAARDLEGHYKPFGSNLRATVVALIRDAADAITPRTDR